MPLCPSDQTCLCQICSFYPRPFLYISTAALLLVFNYYIMEALDLLSQFIQILSNCFNPILIKPQSWQKSAGKMPVSARQIPVSARQAPDSAEQMPLTARHSRCQHTHQTFFSLAKDANIFFWPAPSNTTVTS